MKKSEAKLKAGAAGGRLQSQKMGSLDELTTLIASPLKCVFRLDGSVLEIEVNRMTSAIAERSRALIRSVQPPWKKDRNDYDPLDADYLKKFAEAENKARCVVVYYCCPIVSAKKACASDEEIMAFVQATLPRHLQELISLTAQSGGLELMNANEAANFIAPGGSAS